MAAAGVAFIVAPYEADAQMAYLAKRGVVDIVITEDSDLLVYGCPEVVFKLSRTGECDHIKMQDLPMNRRPSFSGFSHENFIEVLFKFLCMVTAGGTQACREVMCSRYADVHSFWL